MLQGLKIGDVNCIKYIEIKRVLDVKPLVFLLIKVCH